eukprot:tig00020995_g16914.t1
MSFDPKLVGAKPRNFKPIEERILPFARFLGKPDLKPGESLDLSRDELTALLTTTDAALEASLYAHANSVTERVFGNKVYFRGIVEFSNVCQKNCEYCGIRKSMPAAQLRRYTMTAEEIVDCAEFCYRQGYGTLMLQSGELDTERRLNFVIDVIKQIRERCRELEREHLGLPADTPLDKLKGLAVALSIGELSADKYQRLFDAGAVRYLLRIETSNPALYAKLHPADHKWETRHRCLLDLKRIGFQIASGVMVGIPGQTYQDLANDLLFLKELDVDMIGMGPYIYQENTPVGEQWKKEFGSRPKDDHNAWLLSTASRMYSLARILIPDCNITATTALQAIHPSGRELGLNRGCNVLMPILTPLKYRENYQLYQGKPCVDEGATECRKCLVSRVEWSGKDLALGIWGDPPHFFRRAGLELPSETPILPKPALTDKKAHH